MKNWLRPALFILGGALAGLGYYALVGCSTGACAITSSPLRSMVYMGLIRRQTACGGAALCPAVHCQAKLPMV